MITAADRKNDQSGQALIELIIFLPLMFGLYGMIRGFANAINGSINQQKITRAYYYFRIQNNSMVPRPLTGTVDGKWQKFGMSYIGWADYLEGERYPVATCYQITIPLTPVGTDSCASNYSTESTQFVRVGTVYGICGATFAVAPGSAQYFQIPDYLGSNYQELLDLNACAIK